MYRQHNKTIDLIDGSTIFCNSSSLAFYTLHIFAMHFLTQIHLHIVLSFVFDTEICLCITPGSDIPIIIPI